LFFTVDTDEKTVLAYKKSKIVENFKVALKTEEKTMSKLQETVFHSKHASLGANLVEFGGWHMPLHYQTGIIAEHLGTRTSAGLFDVSHMGRFIVRGKNALAFLQYALTNDASRLDPDKIGAQYTLLPTKTGGAVDDAFLYRFRADEYLLVVNASNRKKDMANLRAAKRKFQNVELSDQTSAIAMLALQGPRSAGILKRLITRGELPGPERNRVSTVFMDETEIMAATTGYTGEPVCFELFVPRKNALELWDRLISEGAMPIGLGARDTLRLEAGLPLYGHELGHDADGQEIPILACGATKIAVSFSPSKNDFRGKRNLADQAEALKTIKEKGSFDRPGMARLIKALAVTGSGIARAGFRVFKGEQCVGYVTSGSMVPYPVFTETGEATKEHRLRAVCLAYLDNNIGASDPLLIEVRGKMIEAAMVPRHLRSDTPPYAQPLVLEKNKPGAGEKSSAGA